MHVRSLDGVKYISRSLGGMNHLGSGHVLLNNRQPGLEDRNTTLRETVSTPRDALRHIRRQPAADSRPGKIFSRKSHERERFRAGWMLTLVRQLVELEKRRRDYCSDPRDPADGR